MALMIATAMQAFDATIANVALPQLEASLSGGIELGAWVMTSYLCASAVVAPLTGWVRHRYGARRLFPAAIALYALVSLGCSIAPSAACRSARRCRCRLSGSRPPDRAPSSSSVPCRRARR